MTYTNRPLRDSCDSTMQCLKTCCINGCISKIEYEQRWSYWNEGERLKKLAGIESPSLKYSNDYVPNPGPRILIEKIHPYFLNI